MDKCEHLGSDFTADALRVLDQLQDRAADRGLNLNRFVPELLSWTVLRWEKKVAIAALELMGINRWKLEEDLDGFLETHDSWHSIPHPLESVRDWARQQAALMGTDWKGTEHLLLGAISAACPEFRSFLAEHGVEYEAVKQAILRILGKA
jgi:ATP-dependent Clp protease ATP-binding subunit ClpA